MKRCAAPLLFALAAFTFALAAPAAAEDDERRAPDADTTTCREADRDAGDERDACDPPVPHPEPAPCPDGADQCNQVRSCPVDTPLPPGSQCERFGATVPSLDTPAAVEKDAPVPAGPTPPAPPVAEPAGAEPAVGPAVQASVFGRPAEVLGVQLEREDAPAPAPASRPAPASAPALARTGLTEDLAIIGGLFVVAGIVLRRAGSRASRVIHTT